MSRYTKSVEIDPKIKPHVGTQAWKDGRLYGDKRCRICGDWITWADLEPVFCFEPSVIRKLRGSGKMQCQDFYDRMIVAQQIKRDEVAERALKLTRILQKRGLLA